MTDRFNRSVGVTLMVWDAAAVYLSFLIAFWLRFHTDWMVATFPPRGAVPSLQLYRWAFLAATIIALVAFRSTGMYAPRRREGRLDEAYSVLIACCLAALLSMAASFVYRGGTFSRPVFFMGWALSIVLDTLGRAHIRAAERGLRRAGWGEHRALIVGIGETAQNVRQRLEDHPGLGLRPIGFIRREHAYAPPNIGGLPVLGAESDIPTLRREYDVSHVFIAISQAEPGEVPRLVGLCQQEGLEFLFVSDLFESVSAPISIGRIDGLPVFTVNQRPIDGLARATKRMTDIVVSLTALVLFLPVLIAISVAVKLTSPGHVFYTQKRISRDGRVFHLRKFRTMTVGAEDRSGPVWATPGDARVTRLGRILRRTSLDELPQLWCVLWGRMSLVGPRPERPVFVEEFRRSVPRYEERHRVKCGITGWAQVNGLRGDTSVEERTRYDLYYVENWSLLFDLRIMIKTIVEMLFHKNAY